MTSIKIRCAANPLYIPVLHSAEWILVSPFFTVINSRKLRDIAFSYKFTKLIEAKSAKRLRFPLRIHDSRYSIFFVALLDSCNGSTHLFSFRIRRFGDRAFSLSLSLSLSLLSFLPYFRSPSVNNYRTKTRSRKLVRLQAACMAVFS